MNDSIESGQPQTHIQEAVPVSSLGQDRSADTQDAIQELPPLVQEEPPIPLVTDEMRARVKKVVLYSAIAAGVISFFLFGCSSPFLLSLELYMISRIAKEYHYRFSFFHRSAARTAVAYLGGTLAKNLVYTFVGYVPGLNVIVAVGFVLMLGTIASKAFAEQVEKHGREGWSEKSNALNMVIVFAILIVMLILLSIAAIGFGALVYFAFLAP
jgi:hypothetical protein